MAGLASYTLINDLGSGTISLDNYVLDSHPNDYILRVDNGGKTLDLVAVPEVSSFFIPLLGAAALFWFRRRSAGAAVEAETPAMA